MISGGCLCGAVRYRIDGEPLGMYYCHCQQCRRASGASFATNLIVHSESFALTDGEDLLAAYESSPGKRRHFCSRCGSPIFSHDRATEAMRSVRSGTLDADPGLRPTMHFHVASKSHWFEITDPLPQLPRGPGQK